MSKIFNLLDYKSMLRLNIGAIIVTAFCELFVILIFKTKAIDTEIPQWKYYIFLAGLILVSILFIASVVSLINFLVKSKNKSI